MLILVYTFQKTCQLNKTYELAFTTPVEKAVLQSEDYNKDVKSFLRSN